MPIEVGIWKLFDNKPKKVKISSLDYEERLEDMIVEDISIISSNLMLIGRQVQTSYGKYIDLLAVDIEGNLYVIELKRNKTPRKVVSQLLDYGSWVQSLSYEDIREIYTEFKPDRELEEGFYDAFETNPPEQLNQNHDLIIVASEIDNTTERIIEYLSDNYGVPINAVFFRHFTDDENEYIARTWFISAEDTENRTQKTSKKKEPWNGKDYYVSLGVGEHRRWSDCQKYNYISGGQGKWYSQTLHNLSPGNRVFVNIPGEGFVGVGIVEETAVPVKDFYVTYEGEKKPILEVPYEAPKLGENADDLEKSEYLVRVNWIKAVPMSEAYWEKGMFASQHTVCKMRNKFTLERLIKHFDLDEE